MKPPVTRARQNERGAVLIMALAVVTMLTVLGAFVLQSSGVEMETVGYERSGDEALYIAEAGLQWGLQELNLTYGFAPGTTDFSPILALPVVVAASRWGPGQIVGWHELHPTELNKPYGSGFFRVVVQPAGPQEPDALLVRSLGIAASGGSRLLEVAVTPN